MSTSVRQQLQEAVALAKQGQKFEAQTRVDNVLKDHPDNADAWILMAQLVEDTGRQLECWKRANALRPDDMRIQANMARLQAAEPEFSPYITEAAAAVPEFVTQPKRGQRGKGRGSGCLTMFLLILVALALGAFAYALYMNRVSPGWLGNTIYDQRASTVIFALNGAIGRALEALPDSSDMSMNNYDPFHPDMIPAIADVRNQSNTLRDLAIPLGRAHLAPYIHGTANACEDTATVLERYTNQPNLQTVRQAIDAIGRCQDSLGIALGYLQVKVTPTP